MRQVRYSLFALLLITLFGVAAKAQGFDTESGGPKAEVIKERIMQFKKIKLLELLKLSGDAADKFLVRYSDGQRKIDDAKKQLDEAIQDLNVAVKRGAAQSDIIAKTDNVAKLYDVWNNATRERVAVFKSILSAEQFAQLMMFEIKFPEVLMKMVLKKGGMWRGGPAFGDE